MPAHGGCVAKRVTLVQSLLVCVHHFVCTYNIGSLALLSNDASFASSVHLSELSRSGCLRQERFVLTLPFILCLLLFLVSGSAAPHATIMCVADLLDSCQSVNVLLIWEPHTQSPSLNFNVFSWWAYGLASKRSAVDCLTFGICAASTPCYALTSFANNCCDRVLSAYEP